MRLKFLTLALVLASLVGYLEWAGGNSTFLVNAEAEVISKLFVNPLSVAHPLTLLPLGGQIILLATVFQNRPNRWLMFVGLLCLAALLVLIFIIGLAAYNWKMALSALPFITVGTLTLREILKK